MYYSLHGLRSKQTKVLERGGDYDPQLGIVYIPQTRFGGGPPHRYKVEYIEQYFAKGINPTEHKTVPLSEQPAGSQFDAIGSFVLDEGRGFTQAGITRINDSIRTYVWAVLGAQSQVRTSIIGKGKSFDAQRQFLANVETAIDSAVDIPESIKRYQDTLGYARSKVDFVVGFDLYMMPSDMDLYIGKINGYNNLLVDASESDIPLVLGHNQRVNDLPPIQMDESEDKSQDKMDNPQSQLDSNSIQHESVGVSSSTVSPTVPASASEAGDTGVSPTVPVSVSLDVSDADTAGPSPTLTHDERKLLIILGGSALISSLIWVFG